MVTEYFSRSPVTRGASVGGAFHYSRLRRQILAIERLRSLDPRQQTGAKQKFRAQIERAVACRVQSNADTNRRGSCAEQRAFRPVILDSTHGRTTRAGGIAGLAAGMRGCSRAWRRRAAAILPSNRELTMNEAAPPSPAVPAADTQGVAAASWVRSAARASGSRLFDGGDAVNDDGITRANWAVPWSDLMMTMFVLFAALLATQALREREKQLELQREKAVEVRNQVVEREKIVTAEVLSRQPDFQPPMQINVLARSQDAVREANLQNAQIVLLDDQSVKVSVQGPMFFALGKADVRPEAQRFLDRLAEIIKQTPYDIHVVGHTDDQPISTAAFPSNWELSLVRASHVARYLIKSGGIEPARFVVMGRGEYEPVSAEGDNRARALNRRVEIIITRELSKTEGRLPP
jgi:chemotaxis protein MotB